MICTMNVKEWTEWTEEMDNRINQIREMINDAINRYVPKKIDDYYTRVRTRVDKIIESTGVSAEIGISVMTGDIRNGEFQCFKGIGYSTLFRHIDYAVTLDQEKLVIKETVKELVIKIIEETKGGPFE